PHPVSILAMNPTFTIESVHGVKQTFVLGPSGTVDVSTNRPAEQADREGDEQRRREPEANKPR
ncbi:MAG: hypothetical protein MI861_12375, partial [Pirellulales bacterium]|nr:hypothetical protein [Pirellulales bacterium]